MVCVLVDVFFHVAGEKEGGVKRGERKRKKKGGKFPLRVAETMFSK